MGLDIGIYSKLKKIDCVFNADGEPIDRETNEPLEDDHYFQPYENSDFAGRMEGLEHKAVYSYGKHDHFKAGSYSGYNIWREELAKFAGYPSVSVDRYQTGSNQLRHDEGCWQHGKEGEPFYELIIFSDCEGVIGSVVSAKLAADFKEHQEKADSHQEEWFRVKYNQWRAAFEAASDNGAVDFH